MIWFWQLTTQPHSGNASTVSSESSDGIQTHHTIFIMAKSCKGHILTAQPHSGNASNVSSESIGGIHTHHTILVMVVSRWQRYWSSLRYSFLRTVFVGRRLRRHPTSWEYPYPLYCLLRNDLFPPRYSVCGLRRFRPPAEVPAEFRLGVRY